jgi:hypothetical protein
VFYDSELTGQAILCLLAEAIIETRKHEDEPVPKVCRLSDKRADAGGLPALHVADDQAHDPELIGPAGARILEVGKDLVARVIKCADNDLRAPEAIDEVAAEASPKIAL